MLSKKNLDRKLQGYVGHFAKRGYSEGAIRQALVNSGLDEKYCEKIIRKHKEKEFVRRYAFAASLLLAAVFVFNLASQLDLNSSITGFAVGEIRGSYISLNLNYEDGILRLNKASFVNLEDVIGPKDNEGFLIRIVSKSKDYEDLFYSNISENGNYLVFVRYDYDIEKIQILNENSEIALEINIEEITLP